MQLHPVATSLACSVERVFGYTVQDGSVQADGQRSDYVTPFYFAGCLPFQDCSHVTHDVTQSHYLPLNNWSLQNGYWF